MSCSQCVMCLNGLPSSCTGTKSSDSPEISLEDQELSTSKQLLNGPDEVEDEREDGEYDSRRSSRTTQDDHIAAYYLEKDVRGGRNAATNRSGSRRGNLSDSQGAGRKEAARLFPFDTDGSCEWQGQSNCGGGTNPILGCIEGIQKDRHHGPNKNVSFNEVGNVHRICKNCHNRWHLANDGDYDWNKADSYPKHDPRPMTDEEMRKAALRDVISAGKREVKLARRASAD